MQQQMEAAKATEAKYRTDSARAAAAIKIFEDLRTAEATAEEKRLAAEAIAEQNRLDHIARMLADADMRAVEDACRRKKISVLAEKLSVGHDVADSVLKHLQSLRGPVRHKGLPVLSVLQAINRFAIENGVRFQDAEVMLSN
jgi:hypothetical protein